MNGRQKLGHKIITVARRLFAGTPVQNWRITTYIYKAVFGAMYRRQDIQTNFKGLKLTIPTNDITLAPTIISGKFELKELEIFEELCSKDRVVLDIGANIGMYTLIAASKIGQKGKVYAFEPIVDNLNYLKQNVCDNGFESRVVIVNKAVGEKPGILKIFILKDQIGTHSAVHSGDKRESVQVSMCSIDSFVKINQLNRVDIIKIDVEGYDGKVLSGALETLKKFKPTLFIEYSPQLLKKSGLNLKDFQESIFGIYKNCYLIDEFKDKIYPINKKGLAAIKVATNVNLILTNDWRSNKKIERFIT